MSIPKVKRYENGKEIVGQVDTPYEITWDEWQLLTDTEKEKRKWLITDVPGADGFVTVENMKLLWSNPSPTSAFASQNITLNSADYDFLLIVSNFSNSDSTYHMSTIFEKGSSGFVSYGVNNATSYRPFTYINDTSYTVNNANQGTAVNNSILVPVAVYGFKKQTEIRFNALAQNVKATVDYSTDEHPIGTWIDGSTLYEKTYDCGALPNNGTKSVNLNISNLDIIVSYDGMIYNSAKTAFKPLPVVTNAANTASLVGIQIVNGVLNLLTGNDQSGYNAYITLRYTKTS